MPHKTEGMETRWGRPAGATPGPAVALLLGLLLTLPPAPARSAEDTDMPLAGTALPPDYQSLTGLEKQSLLWDRVSAEPYAAELPRVGLLPFSAGLLFTGFMSLDYLARSVQHADDETPSGRRKLIHRVGSVARVRWSPAAGHPYTGLFRAPTPGLIRLSHAGPGPGGALNRLAGGFTPGWALKLFIDGAPARNLVVIPSLDGQGGNYDFFARAGVTDLERPRNPIQRVLGRRFDRAVKRIDPSLDGAVQRLDRFASIRPDGGPVPAPVVPHRLRFEPGPDLPHDSARRPDFREKLAQIPSGSLLYRVSAQAAPEAPWVHVADVELIGEVIASDYGDRSLFFQHDANGLP